MKKGFTLIELLAVIAILAIIMIIATPKVLDTIENARISAYKQDEEMLKRAALTYLGSHQEYLPSEVGETTKISLEDLKQSKIIDNVTDGKNNCESFVLITKEANNYKYEPYISCGDDYETSTDLALDNLVESVTHVYNSGTDDYTITINLKAGDETKNDVNSITTPTETIGIYKSSLVDYSNWVVGPTAGNSTWSVVWIEDENEIVSEVNPWGQNDTMWATLQNDASSDGDGGYTSSSFAIDNTKLYRYSVWIKRKDWGDGRTYVGFYGDPAGVARVGDPDYRSTNPYATSWMPLEISYAGEWTLHVAFVSPVGTMTEPSISQNDAGIYKPDGTFYKDSMYNFAWTDINTTMRIRSYLYYSTTIDEKQFWYRPRVDLVDGSEPTIEELLAGTENPTMNEYETLNKDGIINYTVSETGTYKFVLNRADGTKYNINYTIE